MALPAVPAEKATTQGGAVSAARVPPSMTPPLPSRVVGTAEGTAPSRFASQPASFGKAAQRGPRAVLTDPLTSTPGIGNARTVFSS